jgi:hypothetical protein
VQSVVALASLAVGISGNWPKAQRGFSLGIFLEHVEERWHD